jgi:hypothetical protein
MRIYLGDLQQDWPLRDLWRGAEQLQRAFRSRQASSPRLSHWILEVSDEHTSKHLQGTATALSVLS